MIFTSGSFVLFFLVVFAIYWKLPHRTQNRFLVLASLFFYGSWDWRFLSLILLCAAVNYWSALRIPEARHPRRWVAFAAIVSLGILGTFKYFNFFLDNANGLLGLIGSSRHFDAWSVILPVGISFYTFQALCYVIDVQRGELQPKRHFGNFLLYVCFFPQLVAGPIERARRLLPQIEAPRRWDPALARQGLLLCLAGFWQKMVIADPLAALADPIFDDPGSASALSLLLALYAFSLQIYCDFSGYSKIARGCARLLGFQLVQNFRQPYLSADLREFWRRWHISLSTWLRDYVYIPLGGNRKGPRRTLVNLMLTMLLGGLWHGASWNFVAWGGLHGLYLAVQRRGSARRQGRPASSLSRLVRILVTFHLVTFAWLFFRAPSFEASATFLQGLLQLSGAWDPAFIPLILGAPALLLLDLCLERGERAGSFEWLVDRRWAAEGLAVAVIFAMVLVVGVPHAKPFIYFQF